MKKILVIEDELSLRKDIIEMLTFEGFDVVGAEDGAIGVREASIHIPDLIICDIMMPKLDGYQVLHELRKDYRTAAIPFIFLTARTDKVDRRLGMEQGADDYLTKPFTVTELLKTVQTRLEKREAIERLSDDRMNKLRDNIILAMPHELRTPLTVILGFSDILNTDCDDMEPQRIREMSQLINSAAMRLYHLVENYLVYAQIELVMNDAQTVETIRAGKTAEPRIVIEDQAIQKAQLYDRERDLNLDIEDVPTISVVEDYLKKMIAELVDNAFKFSDADKPVYVEAAPHDDRYVVRITDFGRGMDSEEIRLMGAYMQFQRRFFEQQGSGLGLIIARRLAEIHGGELTIESIPNHQTTVTIALPMQPTN